MQLWVFWNPVDYCLLLKLHLHLNFVYNAVWKKDILVDKNLTRNSCHPFFYHQNFVSLHWNWKVIFWNPKGIFNFHAVESCWSFFRIIRVQTYFTSIKSPETGMKSLVFCTRCILDRFKLIEICSDWP